MKTLDQETIRLLRSSAAMLPLNDRRPIEAFYDRLFDLAPEVRPLFKIDIKTQAGKLSDMLAWVIGHLENPDELLPALHRLGERHAEYGVEIDHYAPLGSALIWMFRDTMGERFTPEMEEAWILFFAAISTTMERGHRDWTAG